MRRAAPLVLILCALAAPALAQAPAAPTPPPMKLFASSAEVQALIAKARAEHKPTEPNLLQPIVTLAPYRANLEHRIAVGPAAIHDKEAELFYVIDGSGVMVTEGKLTNPTRPNPDNQNGSAIEGGTSRTVGKGDFVFVAEGVPHWFSRIDGELILMTLHVPRGAPRP